MPGPPRPLFADARDVRLEKILVDSACTLPEHRLRGRWDDWFALRVYRARCALPRRRGLGTKFGIDFLRHCRQRNTRAWPMVGGRPQYALKCLLEGARHAAGEYQRQQQKPEQKAEDPHHRSEEHTSELQSLRHLV